jgi:hypothetical protein
MHGQPRGAKHHARGLEPTLTVRHDFGRADDQIVGRIDVRRTRVNRRDDGGISTTGSARPGLLLRRVARRFERGYERNRSGCRRSFGVACTHQRYEHPAPETGRVISPHARETYFRSERFRA